MAIDNLRQRQQIVRSANSFAGVTTEERTGGECLPICQWQTRNMYFFVCLPTGIDSVDIKSGI